MALDVTVKIDLMRPIGKTGFGMPLILSLTTSETPKEYKVYRNIAEVAADYEATTDVYKAANLMFAQTNHPEKIAICETAGTVVEWLGESKNISKEWRQLVVVGEVSADEIVSISAAIEPINGKMFFAGVDTDETGVSIPEGVERTVVFYVDATEDVPYPVAALVGEAAGRKAGSFTYKNLILKGIEPQELSDAEIEAIHELGGITFVTKAGDNVTTEGKVAGGEYVDIVDSVDFVTQQIEYNVQKTLNTADKVPYDNNGIALLEAAVLSALQDAYFNGIIASAEDGKTGDYKVSFALREQTTETDRASRHYPYGQFSFVLAGAVHTCEVTGSITF